ARGYEKYHQHQKRETWENLRTARTANTARAFHPPLRSSHCDEFPDPLASVFSGRANFATAYECHVPLSPNVSPRRDEDQPRGLGAESWNRRRDPPLRCFGVSVRSLLANSAVDRRSR